MLEEVDGVANWLTARPKVDIRDMMCVVACRARCRFVARRLRQSDFLAKTEHRPFEKLVAIRDTTCRLSLLHDTSDE